MYNIGVKMKIINPGAEDYHMHTITFSDGLNSIDEMVQMAERLNMEKIALTDHSQAYLDSAGYDKKTARGIVSMGRWQNVFGGMPVIFGIEGDLLNEEGDISSDIQGVESDFLILSAHPGVYAGDVKKITDAYVKAIERHHERIDFLGHLCSKYFHENVDVEPIVKAANNYGVAVELNSANLITDRTNMEHLGKMLKIADRVYVNSDAHTLAELRDNRKVGLQYLKDNGYMKKGEMK